MIRVEWQKGKEISDFVRSPLGSHVDRRSPVAEHREVEPLRKTHKMRSIVDQQRAVQR